MSKLNNSQSKRIILSLGILIAISIITSIGFVTTYFSLDSVRAELKNSEENRIKAEERLKVSESESKEASRLTAINDEELEQIEEDLIEEKQRHVLTREELDGIKNSLRDEKYKVEQLNRKIQILNIQLDEFELKAKPTITNVNASSQITKSQPLESEIKFEDDEDHIEENEGIKIIEQIENFRAQLESCKHLAIKTTINVMLNSTLVTFEKNGDVEKAHQSLDAVRKAYESSCI